MTPAEREKAMMRTAIVAWVVCVVFIILALLIVHASNS